MQPVNSELFPAIPANTEVAAGYIFGGENFYLVVGNLTGELFSGLSLDDQVSEISESTLRIAMLYLITIFQYMECLSDARAVKAIQKRVDWKYALHLSLDAPGVEFTSLCSFRRWLLERPARLEILQSLLTRLSGIFGATRGQSWSVPAEAVVESVCLLNRLEIIWQAFSQALNILAVRFPEWVGRINLPHWYARYGNNSKLEPLGLKHSAREDLAQSIGRDGAHLLKAISVSSISGVEDMREINILQRIWQEQFIQNGEEVIWRKSACSGCALAARRMENHLL